MLQRTGRWNFGFPPAPKPPDRGDRRAASALIAVADPSAITWFSFLRMPTPSAGNGMVPRQLTAMLEGRLFLHRTVKGAFIATSRPVSRWDSAKRPVAERSE